MGRFRDIVINTGISGNTTQTILSDFDWRIRQFKPTVVSLMIGTNDCSNKDMTIDVFEQNLESLLGMTRKLNAIPIFHTPNVIMKDKAPGRERLSEYVTVIQKMAESKEVLLVDNYTYWQNAIQSQGEATIFKEWLNDPIHPNGSGHSQIARLMFKTLSIFDLKSPTCGAPYYEGEH
jgi:lysophospholipase L1-like esterase